MSKILTRLTASYTAAMAWRNPLLSAGRAGLVAKTTPGVTIDNTGTIVGAPGPSTAIGQAGSGGAGLDLPSDSRLTNSGMITGGVGGDSFDEGGAGGIGVRGLTDDTISNSGTIAGGTGGSGHSTSSGAGGAGIDLLVGGVIANKGTVLGGNGGAVSRQAPGIGGVGIQLEAGGSLTNDGNIVGGTGGLAQLQPGVSGGAGVVLAHGGTVLNRQTILGGTGGTGSSGGGAGGAGTALASGGQITNAGTVTGGTGGLGSTDPGGAGGIGVELEAGGRLQNDGSISGGTGGDGAFGAGAGGTGVEMLNGVLAGNTGTISGGAGGQVTVGSGAAGAGGTGLDLLSGSASLRAGHVVGGKGGVGQLIGGTGGGGVALHSNGVLDNAAQISGGAGGNSSDLGGDGGAGAIVSDRGTIRNSGTIAGGIGGYGQSSSGVGGVGVDLLLGGILVNSGAIAGGDGLFSRYGTSVGGIGVRLESGGLASNSGRIVGGTGGDAELQPGVAGGDGILLAAGGELRNSGTILGGTGGVGESGGTGGVAVELTSGGTVDNTKTIVGGTGALGSSGGVGVELLAGGRLTNHDSISGGNSGVGQFGPAEAGGSGVVLTAGSSLINDGTIAGGNGGDITFGSALGGAGGIGLELLSGSIALHTGHIVGGTGGAGLLAGAGGIGAALRSTGVLDNAADIRGGTGGIGSDVGGAGGAGAIASERGTIRNSGTVAGGTGAYGQQASGAGGVGVDMLAGGAVINSGTILGGDGVLSRLESGIGGNGIQLEAGGSVSNSGRIAGGSGGLELLEPGVAGGLGVVLAMGGQLQNAGTILGGTGGIGDSGGAGGIGVALMSGGTVSNTAAVTGGTGGVGNDGPGGVGGMGVELIGGGRAENHGVISGGIGGSSAFGSGGLGGVGVTLVAGGSVINDGTISNGKAGASNFMAPASGGNAALVLTAGGTVGNGAGAVIASQGGYGIQVSGGPATITDAGTISGTIDAIRFSGSYNYRVILDPGALLIGKVVGGMASNTLELAAGSNGGVGTVTAFGTEFTGFGSIVLDQNARWLLDGASPGGGQVVTLAGTNHILALNQTSAFSDTIAGFGRTDTLDLRDVAYVTGAGASLSGDRLTVKSGATSDTLTLRTPGGYMGDYFHLSNDGHGGTQVTVNGTPCYCRGTLILTDRGEIAVEALRVGDCLVTRTGEARPLRWIGTRSYSGRFASGNHDVLPVMIQKDALADGVPRRDLMVSPLHAMYLDGMLIPAVALVNGSSILQATTIDRVDYFHLELATHDVIIAEGALSESFVDDGSRGMFQNAAEYSLLYPNTARSASRYCAPRVDQGEPVETVRRRLQARMIPAEGRQGERAHGVLRGCVDDVGNDRIKGWACETDSNAPVELRILHNGIVVGQVVADLYRGDLQQAGIGDGRHGFEMTVPGGLSPLVRHVIQVQRAADGHALYGSPWVMEASPLAKLPEQPPAPTCHGHLDITTRDRLVGWAQHHGNPDIPVAVQILDNGVPIARVLANGIRPDLVQAGVGLGRHGFDLAIPAGLSPLSRHVIQAFCEMDGTELLGSPVVFEAAGCFDVDLEQTITRAVASVASEQDDTRVLSFMLARVDQLRQQAADRAGDRSLRLQDRQQHRLHGPAATDTPGPGLRALVLDEQVPAAGRDGGSTAILSHIEALQQLGYAVTFAAADATDEGGPAVQALRAQGIAVCGSPFYASVEEVLRRQADCFDVVYLHRMSVAARYLKLARRHMPRARILYSVADLHHVRLARQAEIEERPDLLASSRQCRLEEFTAAWSADAVLTHSADEEALLRQAVPDACVHRVPWHVPMPDGIAPFAARHGIAFIGNYAHAPNRDAAVWLVETVMPIVWATCPQIECLLVGADMPDSIRLLARPGVVALGHVPDLADMLSRVRLTVAPLRYGAGVKSKILDSLAAGVPCVMTEAAAEGLSLPRDLEKLVGQGAASIASLICRLHQDESAHHDAAASGLSLVRENHGSETVRAALRAAIENYRPMVTGQEQRIGAD